MSEEETQARSGLLSRRCGDHQQQPLFVMANILLRGVVDKEDGGRSSPNISSRVLFVFSTKFDDYLHMIYK